MKQIYIYQDTFFHLSTMAVNYEYWYCSFWSSSHQFLYYNSLFSMSIPNTSSNKPCDPVSFSDYSSTFTLISTSGTTQEILISGDSSYIILPAISSLTTVLQAGHTLDLVITTQDLTNISLTITRSFVSPLDPFSTSHLLTDASRSSRNLLLGAKPNSLLECWGQSPNQGHEDPEDREQSPSLGLKVPQPSAEFKKKLGKGLGSPSPEV